MRDQHLVTCPCCKGKKRLSCIEHDERTGRTFLSKPMCCHCDGKGVVEAEIAAPLTRRSQPS